MTPAEQREFAAKQKALRQSLVVTMVVTKKRSADRHKGSRAAYMRAYRAAKKEQK